MSNPAKLYLREIYDAFSFMGTWLPNANLRLGDVGVLEGEAFKQITTLKDLGIPFKVREGEKKSDFTYTSKSGVRLKTKVAGEVAVGSTLPLANAGVSIQFEDEGAFLFQAAGCVTDEIGNRLEVGQAILKLLQAEIWKANWAVVSTLVHADSDNRCLKHRKRRPRPYCEGPAGVGESCQPRYGVIGQFSTRRSDPVHCRARVIAVVQTFASEALASRQIFGRAGGDHVWRSRRRTRRSI